jgi:hypothetical protein
MAFGFIGKAFKGIKKVAKKIGKGIKKIAKKVLGAIGKIGPIGQLALMFIGIPPVISNFFGGIGGAITGALGQAGTAITNFATKIAPNLTKGLGKAFNAIKTAGQGAYNTITQAIGNGVDRVMNFTKGKGFTLSGDRTSIFGGVSAKDIPVPGTVTPETAAKFGPDIPDVSDIKGDVFSSTIDASPASVTPPSRNYQRRSNIWWNNCFSKKYSRSTSNSKSNAFKFIRFYDSNNSKTIRCSYME